VRTRTDNSHKVDDNRTYTFSGSGIVPGEDTGFEAPASSTSLPQTTVVSATAIGGITTTAVTKATIKPADNGFYNRHVHNKQKQSGSKPIREWYV